MAHAVSFPTRATSEHRGLAFWMKRSLEELALLRSNPSPDVVHDVRVALRRCRSVASAIEEIDPHPDWQEMRDCARKLFRSLGELRDAQVMIEWLKELHPEDDPLKTSLLAALAKAEESSLEQATENAGRFDAKRWKELSRTLGARIRRVPADGDAARCLSLERLEEAKELHRRAMRTETPKPWHALRIGVKHFRYSVESLLPGLHPGWAESLKRVQDVLGNIHDLDVLAAALKRARAEQPGDDGSDWMVRIERRRQQNLETYRQLALGQNNIWQSWQSGFPREHRLRYAAARIGATRKSLDRKPGRSLSVSRISARLWSQLRASKVDKVFVDAKQRQVLEASARLSGIRAPDAKKPREKSARTFLLKSPLPPGWSFEEWECVAWAIRFQRSSDPSARHKRFSKLSAEQQARICLHAGILRMAVALQKCGVHSGRALHVENLPQGLLLHVVGVEDNPENDARFSEAKRLLERSLAKTILIQSEPEALALADRKQKLDLPKAIAIVQ
jgi:CHAD domain-containing protein